ncbi:aconitase X [Chloroflexota bacterium]
MKLTDTEQRMIDGKDGKAVAMAMTILSKLGQIYGAEEMIPISQVHIDSSAYKAIGEAGLEFAEKLADSGARFCVPTTLNPASRDIERWQEFRIPADFAEKSRRLEQAYLHMGATPTWTCAPYLYGIIPRFGQQVAWGESNAINFVNSVIGARTARYGDFAEICAAVTGRAPNFSLHLSQNRAGEVLLRLQDSRLINWDDDSLYPLIGYIAGSAARGRIPVIDGIPNSVTSDHLKGLSAAAASSGSVALFHILGVTPEAATYQDAFQGRAPLEIIDISEAEMQKARQDMSTTEEGKVDLVIIGCPHASFPEIAQLIRVLDSRKISPEVEFWVQTNRIVSRWLKEAGLLAPLETSGVKVINDTCIFSWPIENWGFRLAVTNSGKFAHYTPGMLQAQVVFGSLGRCVEAAVTGEVSKI